MPILPGHESSYLNMSKYGHKDWIKSVDVAYNFLKNKVDDVVVIGFSMGGLLAINLEEKYKPKAIITINTPIYHWNFPQIIKNLKEDLFLYTKKYVSVSLDKPVNSLLEFKVLLSSTKPKIKTVTTPMLVIQTQDDDTTVPKSADYFCENVKGVCHIYKVAHGGHVVLNSQSKNIVISKVIQFIKSI